MDAVTETIVMIAPLIAKLWQCALRLRNQRSIARSRGVIAIESRCATVLIQGNDGAPIQSPRGRPMNALLRIAVIVASFAIAADCASQQPATGAETSCNDEDHCQVVVTIACSFVMMCSASVDF